MKFADPNLRDKLAAEYVVGTLSARARRRFEQKLKENPQLRQAVLRWENRLSPLTDAIPAIEPPERVWQAIQARIRPGRRASTGLWNNLAFWRFSSIATGLAAAALLVVMAVPRPQGPPSTDGRMVVVMADVQTKRTAMTATWEPGIPGKPGKRAIRIRVIGHAEMGPHTAWELWMLPGQGQKPLSLGLITTHETQVVVVPEALAARLDEAMGLAMSVEPAGGSPTGLPTGPVLYAGECVKT
jgi:anti-sigma-K factor RskA